jgi:hypothetical protein
MANGYDEVDKVKSGAKTRLSPDAAQHEVMRC